MQNNSYSMQGLRGVSFSHGGGMVWKLIEIVSRFIIISDASRQLEIFMTINRELLDRVLVNAYGAIFYNISTNYYKSIGCI
jgi:hypothetical protein